MLPKIEITQNSETRKNNIISIEMQARFADHESNEPLKHGFQIQVSDKSMLTIAEQKKSLIAISAKKMIEIMIEKFYEEFPENI